MIRFNGLLIIILFNATNSYAQIDWKVVYPPNIIIKNDTNIQNYIYHLRLWKNFTAYDDANNKISKAKFLKRLSLGEYIPLWLKSRDTVNPCYQLYKIDTVKYPQAVHFFRELGKDIYAHYQMEGVKYPNYSYVDTKGNVYTNKSIKGKIVIFNYFFLACGSCNIERPSLNKITQLYKKRKDILFIALDNDSPYDNKRFMAANTFYYHVVRVSEKYMEDSLKVQAYPQNIIVNKKGYIVKAFYNDPLGLAIALKEEASKK